MIRTGNPLPRYTVAERLVRLCASRKGDSIATGLKPDSAALAAAIWAGVVPQQPPIVVTPASTIFGIQLANCSGLSGNVVRPSDCSTGMPALGRKVTGSEVAATILAITGNS